MGSASVQGRLWGHAPRDWAEVVEPQLRPLAAATLGALAPLAGVRLLDAGCGTGLTLKLAAEAGAHVSGLDAAASGPGRLHAPGAGGLRTAGGRAVQCADRANALHQRQDGERARVQHPAQAGRKQSRAGRDGGWSRHCRPAAPP
jgi:SAM-dependent methyltransferase